MKCACCPTGFYLPVSSIKSDFPLSTLVLGEERDQEAENTCYFQHREEKDKLPPLSSFPGHGLEQDCTKLRTGGD